MKKISIFTSLFAMVACCTSQAAIIEYSETFSTTEGLTGWASVGTLPTVIARVSSTQDYDDGDPESKISYSEGMLQTGDGIYGDGALRIDIQDTTGYNEAVGYTLSGTLDLGEEVTFNYGIINQKTAAYSYIIAQIWDITANQLLASSSEMSLPSYNNGGYTPIDGFISYVATSETAGHSIQIRFTENVTGAATQDLYVDNVSVTSVIPEPGTLSLLGIGALAVRIIRRKMSR